MPATKTGKLHVKVRQVDGSEKLHVLWPVKYCTKVSVNPFLLTYEYSQGSNISRDHKNNIVVQAKSGDIILHHLIKAHNDWVASIEFLQETHSKRAQIAKPSAQQQKMDLHILHADLGHPLDVITQATDWTMGLNLTVIFLQGLCFGKSQNVWHE